MTRSFPGCARSHGTTPVSPPSRRSALSLPLPTLETLSFDVTLPPFRNAIITDLNTAAPRLKVLEFRGHLNTDDTSEIKSLLLSYTGGLTELLSRYCDISGNLFRVIAAWPRLRWLTLQLASKSIPTVPFHVPQPFLALSHLRISCESLSISMSFLCAVGTDSETSSFGRPNLKTIQINAHRCSSASIWSELLDILTRAKLKHIILTERCLQVIRDCHIYSSLDIRPLLVCPASLADLKTLIFSPHVMPITLHDADILMLARTCPSLDILDLQACNTPISLYALGTLVRSCRELRKVSLRVDVSFDVLGATPPNNNDNDQTRLQPNSHLTKLDLGESLIACVGPLNPPTAPDLMISIPRFLHAMAPRLASVVTGRVELPYRRMAQNERWKMVSDALSQMAKGG